MTNYQYLIQQLDGFIRKFYVNKIIRGALWTTGVVLGMWLIFSLLEYQFYFSQSIRKFFFFSLIGGATLSSLFWLIKPLLSYLNLGSTLSRTQAAQIIGEHFPEVQDKLLNVLQLEQSIHATSYTSRDLIKASVNQKSAELRPTPFQSAIDLSKNKKHLKYALIPILFIGGIFLFAPAIMKEGTTRIINNSTKYERARPFDFILDSERLTVIENEDFKLNMRTEGDYNPEIVYINTGGFQQEMIRIGEGLYEHTFRNVKKDQSFRFSANGFLSNEYTLDVRKKPRLGSFNVMIHPPAYTGIRPTEIENIGDLNIPEGSQVHWDFTTQSVDALTMQYNDKSYPLQQDQPNEFSHSLGLHKNGAYQLIYDNHSSSLSDSLEFIIQLIPDEYPSIQVNAVIDSTDEQFVLLDGTVSDDYGISSLKLHYEIRNNQGSLIKEEFIPITVQKQSLASFEYILDLKDFALNNGEAIQYYLEVYDNDAVNGSKSSKSKIYSFKKANPDEIKEEIDKNTKEVNKKLEDRLDKAKEIRERLKKLREKLLQKKESDWRDKKDLEKILEEQKQLEKELEDIKNKLEENLEKQKELSPEKEEMLKKQEELKELFEKMMDEETKELMKKIQELMEKMDKEEMLEMTEKMEMNEEEVEQEMERMKELYKQLDLENRMNEQQEKLEELAKKQEELAKKTKEEGTTEENKKAQEEIEKEFEEIKKDMDQIKKENEELENKVPFGDMSEEEQEVQEKLDDAEQQMEQNKAGKASESQQQSAESMQKMAKTMQAAMEGGQAEQQQEDMAVLRQILENLVTISYEQEDLINAFDRLKTNTPKFVENVQWQFKLIDDFKIVEDSLIALSKRNAQIKSFVLEKVQDVKYYFKDAKVELEERKVREGQQSQQRAMTNVNDLALMLSEAMSSMQQQMSKGMPGNQNCNKPGGSNPKSGAGQPKDQISKGQKSLNQQMKELLDRKGQGGQATSEEIAKMAAKQAALRRALEKMEREAQQSGQNAEDLRKIMDEMNKVEKDLVNKRLTNELLNRQEMIESRLLESERAERERGKDNKRKSESGDDQNTKLPPKLEEYLKNRRKQIEEYQKSNPNLTPFYKNMVEEYFQSLQL